MESKQGIDVRKLAAGRSRQDIKGIWWSSRTGHSVRGVCATLGH